MDMVLIPGAGGDFGVLPGHVPTVSALKPGVMEVHKTDKDIVKVPPHPLGRVGFVTCRGGKLRRWVKICIFCNNKER